jgi:hypothetical protein
MHCGKVKRVSVGRVLGIALLGIVASAPPADAATYGFSAPTSFPAGGARWVTTGDLDRDGDLDLVTANPGGDDVSVLLGDGSGGFAAAIDYPVGNEPLSATIGDFDQDGDLDVATANNISGDVSVLHGNGDGTFAAATAFDADADEEPGSMTDPVVVVNGDFDGDGLLDLATANDFDTTVSVLLGNGDGSFGAATEFPSGSEQTGDRELSFEIGPHEIRTFRLSHHNATEPIETDLLERPLSEADESGA